MTNWKALIDDYLVWIKDNTYMNTLSNGEGCEFVSPFMDRHNDHLAIYVKKVSENEFKLSDDGYIISDLEMSGMEFNSPNRKKYLKQILNGHGVGLDDSSGELFVYSSWSKIPKNKHSLLQSMLAVNDLFTLSKESVHNLFKEDLYLLFNSNNVPVVPNVQIAGKSGFSHTIDFIIAERKLKAEIRIKAINNPRKDAVESAMFAFSDISLSGERSGENIVVYNDLENKISNSNLEALEKYGIGTISYSDLKANINEYV